jgi:hypothetical protein
MSVQDEERTKKMAFRNRNYLGKDADGSYSDRGVQPSFFEGFFPAFSRHADWHHQ